MKASFSQEDEAFREEVSTWIKENASPEILHKSFGGTSADFESLLKWHNKLYQKGWLALGFPKERGGAGLDDTKKFLFNYEYSLSGAPRLKTKIPSLGMMAPILIHFGTEEQQDRFIPDMLSAKTVWAQGFSEPNAGSDLASLKVSAIPDGDDFIVDGQKVWSSMANHADWVFALVRTDSSGKKQQGISFLLIDLKSPGVTVRPIEALMDDKPFCEIFFDNVRVPKENLVGELHQGWNIAKSLMEFERINVFPIGDLIYALDLALKHAKKNMSGGKPLIENKAFRRKLAELEVEAKALLYTFYKALSKSNETGVPGVEANILKVCGAELYQKTIDLNMEALGVYAQSWYNLEECDDIVHQITKGWLCARSMTIGGGSSEIQRTIIALQVLGLPRK